MLSLEGVIEEIKFRNETNGYTVAKLHTSDGLVTIVGYVPFINLEEKVKVEGEWIYHPTYGEQLNFTSLSTVVPSTLTGIEKYLSSGLIPYIGPKTAKKIVEKFGLESLEVIQYNPERLKEIEGIGDKKLEKIVKAYEEQRELRDIMVFLQQFGITVNYGIRIYKKYGKDTINIISENPYRLSEDVFGIGFKTADQIAQKMGISIQSPYRIEAGIKYIIMEHAGNGHCYVPKEELIFHTSKLLQIEDTLIEESIRDLAIKGNVHLINEGDETLVYYTPFHVAENNVSKKIVELSRVDLEEFNVDVEKEIQKIEEEEGINFAKKQVLAIKESLNNGLIVVTGGPGTGKTTTINAIIKIFEDLNLSVVLAAPTGRAAKRMTETTGREAKTIHRLLEYSFMEEDIPFGKDEDSPIEGDLIIIDEASMIDILLMNSLLKAINPGTRLILVGDVDQLPSVGPGNVLKDIINSGVVKVVELDEIFRQAGESMIIVNAHRINKGESPYLNEKNKDFYFMTKPQPNLIVDTILDLCKERLPNFYGVDPVKDIQVLTPMKKGDVGINSLNKHLQAVLNPKAKEKSEKQMGDDCFRVGDKVMQIKNNYTTEWKLIRNGIEIESGEGVFNGDFGFITDIDEEDRIIKVLFDEEKEVEYDYNQLDELKLAYATTVHKSQGSEFPVVVMPIYWGPPMLLTRNLLYTAITRAKKLVVLVGEERYLSMMVKNNRITKRYSSLDSKIRNIMAIF
ncbi:ATP-dependent RecD-like DNA helicase [Tissierella sp. MSJ-40]|uniref:ATP-dependent RecD2 DNA helicase n=1 Tax=Tissierella simiarum TaxID=2841534 RepID=A0ABS6E1A9_9FIRM|nr:ATP-dependent RecD-like DNA helicase [Tissierella simiarum]MBU5436683.1 ATP-dependent RecD-like DNA helicase [Tissierella simiarum]